jgi:hypothetical protein
LLTIEIDDIEYYDSGSNQFKYEDGGTFRFEYSLRAVYEWESKWKKPFLKDENSEEELMDFYMKMALDPISETFITDEVISKLTDYIKDSNSATKFSSSRNGQNGTKTTSRGKVYTAEEIYALMFSAGVPLEFENRNLNRLLVILNIIALNNNPPKKMSKQEILRENASLNAQRKAKMNTRG